MAFWDKVGGSISNTGKNVAAKAKEVAAVSSLHGQIHSQKEIVELVYREIGKQYFEANQKNPGDEYIEKFAQIKETQQKIENLNEEIRKVKGIALCTSCEAEIPRDSAFCPNCGARVVVAEPETEAEPEVVSEQEVCQNCGATVEEGAIFCSECGTKIE